MMVLLLLAGCPGPVEKGDDTGAAAIVDADGDGYGGADDCNDASSAVHPGADEVCDGLDNDCDVDVDEEPTNGDVYYVDADGDGYGDADTSTVACEAAAGLTATAGDCDDGDATFHPGADEADCTDPADYNCDGSVGYADADGDGFAACEDCDDLAAAVHPDAVEACNGTDDDCDGDTDEAGATGETTWYADVDADGYGDATDTTSACAAPAGYVSDATDCDSARADIHPDAPETDCTDPTDYNCDGSVGYADADGDGFAACADCDDLAADVNADAVEACNGVDDNCDGALDEAGATGELTWYADADSDGYGDASNTLAACDVPSGFVADATDCDDRDATVNPDSVWYRDADGDGYGGATFSATQCAQPVGYVLGATDCDDYAATTHPGGTEVCDGSEDEDCDGLVDDADATTDPATLSVWYHDADGDGYGGTSTVTLCSAPSAAYVDIGGDCSDTNAAISPSAVERCDAANTDEDCDGNAEEAGATGEATWYADVDADGFGDASSTLAACDLPTGYAATATDCDDGSAAVSPGAVEICDASNTDEDCDGSADDLDASASAATKTTFYRDSDGDGYGASATTTRGCDLPSGYATTSTDCNDASAAIRPSATEVCDSANTDEDCDGLADDADTSTASSGKVTLYADADLDGYGNASVAAARCDTSAAWLTDYSDCDDSRSAVNPAATETCSTSYDDDCDSATNEVGAVACTNFYADVDGDTYGSGGAVCQCAGSGVTTATIATDCDDATSGVHPGATEACDGVDQDCDASIDEGLTLYYTDADADGYGTGAGTCTSSSGTSTLALDCDDGDAAVNPGEAEVCDEADVDEDCDGYVDDADASVTGTTDWYPDADLDGYGSDAASPTAACVEPDGYVAGGDDCDDGDVDVNPASNELYGDAVDEDCDGSTTPSRTYCTPNVGTSRTYATVSAAVSAGATSICLDVGSFTGTSADLSIPLYGQGLGESTYVGDIADDATDVTVDGSSGGSGSYTLTRVDIDGRVYGSCSGTFSQSVTVYDSILRAGATVSAYASTSASASCSATIYNSYITGPASISGYYGLGVAADGNYTYGRTATATLYCYGCTFLDVASRADGAYYAYATDQGVARIYLYNTVYEAGVPYTYQGSHSTTSVTRSNTSTDTGLLDTAYEPPRPTGALIDGGSASYGRTTDFWGVTRSATPDIGAVEY